MKLLRRIFLFLMLIIGVGIILAYTTGNAHILTAIQHTYLKGRSGPAPDEFTHFPSRTIAAGKPKAWPLSSHYNHSKIPDSLKTNLEALQPLAFLVVHNDSLLFENYWEGRDKYDLSNSFSMAKTVVSMLAGIAIKEGKLPSLDVSIKSYFNDFKGPYSDQVTLRHLLNMSSGIEFDEDYISPFAYPARAYYGKDIETLTMSYNSAAEPGKNFQYLSGNTELAAFILEHATGKKIATYASEKLWIPLGAESDATWSTDTEDGMEKAYCCINSHARDFAKLGHLYLHKGNCKGLQLIDTAYVEESITPAGISDPETNKPITKYGLSWWLCEHRGKNVFYARGILGQYIMVIPEDNIVAVRLGRKRLKEKRNDHPIDLFTYLDLALTIAGK